ncbi:MAG: hypothetical protein AB1779_03170 [Candidatus Thermoplasmatota archaeon]
MKNERYLDALNTIVKMLLKDEIIKKSISNLKKKIQDSEEPFIWSVINPDPFQQILPSNVRSIWIFVLKKDTSSIAHYHSNTTQHTVMIEGKGKVKIGDRWKDLRQFVLSNSSNQDVWCVIDKNTCHEFFPQEKDMVVVSFHTCLPEELVEIKCDSREQRVYER